MAYPRKLLSPGEEVVKEFRPHWQVLIFPIFVTLVAIAAAVVVAIQLTGGGRLAAMAGVVIVWLVLTAKRLIDWLFTQYVITNERVIFRAGVIARRGNEIPLEVVNDVAFTQSVFERIVGSGDLLIESAGEFGQSRYTNIPDPEAMQSLIYQVRERRKVALEGGGGRSIGQELETLARLRDQGVISPAEFDAQKKKLLES